MTLDELLAEKVSALIEAKLPALAQRIAEITAQRLFDLQAKVPLRAPEAASHRILSLPAAAKYLGVGQTTLRGWVKEKRLPFTCPGGKRYRFRVEDLEAFARQPPSAPPQKTQLDYAEQSRRNLERALGRSRAR